jgi:hypothetical protein
MQQRKKMPQPKMSVNPHLIKVDGFSKQASTLRNFFDQQFKDHQSLDSKRFVWDYWYVPDQYQLMRTPAYHYFPEKMYLKFHQELVAWGRKTLGCWDISPPWLSYYTEGGFQNFHSDVPHGPWAYVFSLSPQELLFQGGETLLLKPEVLSYWKNFGTSQDRERSSFLETVSPDFNRLIVFDPRIPHGVTRVSGVSDPREARLVIHGWFTEPKTYLDGYLPEEAAEATLNEAFDQIQELCAKTDPFTGTLSLQLKVSAAGAVTSVTAATNTLKTLSGDEPTLFLKSLLKVYLKLKFPKARGSTQMTIPLIFQ